MVLLVQIVHILAAIFMILVILVQGGNSGGMSAAFGGGSNTGGVLGTGANTFFSKLTYGAAIIFMVTSVILTVYSSKSGSSGLTEALERKAQTESAAPVQPEETPAAAEEAPQE